MKFLWSINEGGLGGYSRPPFLFILDVLALTELLTEGYN